MRQSGRRATPARTEARASPCIAHGEHVAQLVQEVSRAPGSGLDHLEIFFHDVQHWYIDILRGTALCNPRRPSFTNRLPFWFMAVASGPGSFSTARLKRKSCEESMSKICRNGRKQTKERGAKTREPAKRSSVAAHVRARVSVVRVCATVRARDAPHAFAFFAL